MILARTVHDLVELVLVALLLLAAEVTALALAVLPPWSGGACPRKGNLGSLLKVPSMTQHCVPEPSWEIRQDIVV